ncbi:hypothetical protein NKDENANG_03776 [Candidatus Entotheonellaceae bacterium PAL068K]
MTPEPGPLHFGLTPEQLFVPHESRPWNPLIARTFYRRGIIEEWGRGTLKMVELTTAAGLPRPKVEEIGGGMMVCFRHGQYVPSRRRGSVLIDRQEAILALLAHADAGLTLREIRAQLALQTSERQVRRALAMLRDRGLVVSTGPGPVVRWKRVRGQ